MSLEDVVNRQASVIKKQAAEIDNLKRLVKNMEKVNNQNVNSINTLQKRMDKIDAYFSRRR